jgi:hypothetical protein
MQNDFSFLPKLSLGLNIWEVSIGCAIWATAKKAGGRSTRTWNHRTQDQLLYQLRYVRIGK